MELELSCMQTLGALSQDTDSPSCACELTVVNGVLLGVRFKVVAGGNVLRCDCVVPGPVRRDDACDATSDP